MKTDITRECDRCGERFSEPTEREAQRWLREVESKGEVFSVCAGTCRDGKTTKPEEAK